MNPNWTGRAARTLSECRFTDDANPFERSNRETSSVEIIGGILGLIAVMLIVWLVAQ